jgi:DNA-directed RNA polymerase specialized sigma24 family protein
MTDLINSPTINDAPAPYPPATGEIVPRAANGDDSAWRQIVETYQPMLHSIARRYRLDEATSADAVQET